MQKRRSKQWPKNRYHRPRNAWSGLGMAYRPGPGISPNPNRLRLPHPRSGCMDDPIIAEVRAARDAHAARFGYDVAEIFRDIRAMQEASGSEYVRHPARRVVVISDDSPSP